MTLLARDEDWQAIGQAVARELTDATGREVADLVVSLPEVGDKPVGLEALILDERGMRLHFTASGGDVVEATENLLASLR